MLKHFLAFYITLDLFNMTAGGNVEHQEQPRKYTRENLVVPEKYGRHYTSSFIKQLIQAAKNYSMLFILLCCLHGNNSGFSGGLRKLPLIN